jgi:hypothetical protein
MGSDAGRTLGMIGLGLGGAMLGGWLLGPTIGVGLGYLGGSFVGQMLFPTKTKMGMPAAAQYPTQQAMKGQSIPIGYGTNRVAGNMIWLGDLQTYTVEQGGKGGGPEVEQTMYYRSFCFALCEGERHVLRGWAGKHEIAIGPSYSYEGEAVSIDEGKVRSAFGGAIQQEVTIFEGDGVNSGLADLIGEDYVEGYKDLCCVFVANWDLGQTSQIPNFTWEVSQDVPYGFYLALQDNLLLLDTSFKEVSNTTVPADLPSGNWECVDVDTINGRVLVGVESITANIGPWVVYNRDMTEREDITVEVPAGANFTQWKQTLGHRAIFSADGSYVYANFRDSQFPADGHLCKWDSTTGAVEWHYEHDTQAAHAINVDSHDCVYFSPSDNGGYPAVRDADGGNLSYYYAAISTPKGVLIDEGLSSVFWYGEVHEWLGVSTACVWKYDIPSYNPITETWSMNTATVRASANLHEDGVGVLSDNNPVRGLVTIAGQVFCEGQGKLIKLTSDLEYVTHVDLPAGYAFKHLFRASANRFGVVCGLGLEMRVLLYDTNLNLSSTVDPDYTGPAIVFAQEPNAVFSWYGLGGDANPSDIIYDLLTHERYGCRMPDTYIDAESFETIRLYCETQRGHQRRPSRHGLDTIRLCPLRRLSVLDGRQGLSGCLARRGGGTPYHAGRSCHRGRRPARRGPQAQVQ